MGNTTEAIPFLNLFWPYPITLSYRSANMDGGGEVKTVPIIGNSKNMESKAATCCAAFRALVSVR